MLSIGGDAVLAMDPVWRESESGASVVVFESGTIYEAHPDHEGTLDPLRFVALDAGVLEWDDVVATDGDPALEGEDFRTVYRFARQRYGAPLPEWEHPDANHTAALPAVDDLVANREDTDARLQAAYDEVATEYDRAASADDATLLQVLPGLGKTENVFRQADEHPALYVAPRKELMASAVERADANGVSAYVLPVFSERGPPSAVTEAGVAAVRDRGQHLLRDRWGVVEAIEERLAARDDPDTPDGIPAPGAGDGSDDDTDVDLVGAYVHAHVEGARTFYTRTESERVEREPRVVAVDEFPGDAYASTFGEEFPDIAAWLAGCLREDVADRQALFQRAGECWNDEHVRAWLEGTVDYATAPEYVAVASTLELAADVRDAVETARWLLEERPNAVADVGVTDALQALVNAAPAWTPATVRDARSALTAAVDDPENRGGHPGMLSQLADLVDHDALRPGGDRPLVDRLEDCWEVAHIGGISPSWPTPAISTARNRAWVKLTST